MRNLNRYFSTLINKKRIKKFVKISSKSKSKKKLITSLMKNYFFEFYLRKKKTRKLRVTLKLNNKVSRLSKKKRTSKYLLKPRFITNYQYNISHIKDKQKPFFKFKVKKKPSFSTRYLALNNQTISKQKYLQKLLLFIKQSKRYKFKARCKYKLFYIFIKNFKTIKLNSRLAYKIKQNTVFKAFFKFKKFNLSNVHILITIFQLLLLYVAFYWIKI